MFKVNPIAVPRTLVLPSIVIAVLISIELFNWSHRVRPDQQGIVSGQLLEWSEIQLSKGMRTLRFTVSGSKSDFRIAPQDYDNSMNQKIPIGFIYGAKLKITADSAQIASPDRSLFDPSTSIIRVNGLSVDGRPQFDVTDAVENEKRNRFWFFVLLGVALVWFALVTVDWRLGQKHASD